MPLLKMGVETLKICILCDLCNLRLVFVSVVHAEQEFVIIHGLPIVDKPLYNLKIGVEIIKICILSDLCNLRLVSVSVVHAK